jgi:hypothetical protein
MPATLGVAVGERSIGVAPEPVLTALDPEALAPPHPVRLPRATTIPATNIECKPKPAFVI